MVERDVARLERLLGAVREIARIDAEVEEEPRERIPIAELLGNLLEAFRLRWGARVRFALEDASGGGGVLASPERLTEAFENLIDNAASFAPAGSEVRVAVRREGTEIAVEVRDQGPGIPEEHLERVFDRFFSWRPDDLSPDPSLGHMGLGLAIARAVFESYGGSLKARNEPSGGACFEARLPGPDASR
jgi:two-component system sensor histidine kinase ChvG